MQVWAGGCNGRGVLAAAAPRLLQAPGEAGTRAGAATVPRTWLSAVPSWSAEGWACAGTGGVRLEPFVPHPAGRDGRPAPAGGADDAHSPGALAGGLGSGSCRARLAAEGVPRGAGAWGGGQAPRRVSPERRRRMRWSGAAGLGGRAAPWTRPRTRRGGRPLPLAGFRGEPFPQRRGAGPGAVGARRDGSAWSQGGL